MVRAKCEPIGVRITRAHILVQGAARVPLQHPPRHYFPKNIVHTIYLQHNYYGGCSVYPRCAFPNLMISEVCHFPQPEPKRK